MEIVPVSFAQRFPAIQSGDIDVIVKVTGWTMSRDTELGLQYSLPYFMGTFLSMARTDLGAQGVADLEGGVFCVNSGTTVERVLADYMESRGIEYQSLAFEKSEELRAAFYAGRCDAIPGFSAFLTSTKANATNPDDFVILDEVLALEPQGIVVRQGEDDFLDIVNWMISSMLMAEELGSPAKTSMKCAMTRPRRRWNASLACRPASASVSGSTTPGPTTSSSRSATTPRSYDRTIGDGSRYKLKARTQQPLDQRRAALPARSGLKTRNGSTEMSALPRPDRDGGVMQRLLSSQRFRRSAIQTAFVVIVSALLLAVVLVGHRNITSQGIASGFGFLERTTGWPIGFSVIEVSSRSTYARVLFAGLLNTLLVGVMALFFGSLLGFIVALLRVSSNRLMALVGTIYVEVFRQRASNPAGFLLVRCPDASAEPTRRLRSRRSDLAVQPWVDGACPCADRS